MRPTQLLITAALVLSIPHPLAAQLLMPGDTIRLRSPRAANPALRQGWHVGTFIRIDGDTLWYRSDAGPTGATIANVKVKRPSEGTNGARGAILGALGGALLFGAMAYSNSRPEPYIYSTGGNCPSFPVIATGVCDSGVKRTGQRDNRSRDAQTGAILGGLAGGAIGLLLGNLHRKWIAVDPDQLRVSVNGSGLQFTLVH
jgi:hypothetical protein